MAQLLGTSAMLWGGRRQWRLSSRSCSRAHGPGWRSPSTAPPADNLVVWKALTVAAPGDALVIATGGHVDHAVWGEMTGRAAAKSGVAAIITDGAVRDVEGLREVGVPVYAAAVTPNSPKSTALVKSTRPSLVPAGHLPWRHPRRRFRWRRSSTLRRRRGAWSGWNK